MIDLGTLFHVTAHCHYFISYVNSDYGHVRMGNKGASKIVGIRDISLKNSIDCKFLLKDVKHVQDIHLNLISTGKLKADSYINQFGERKCKLSKGSLVSTKWRKVNILYVLQAKVKKEEVNVAVKDFDIKTWYKRLGHIDEKMWRFLQSFIGISQDLYLLLS